MVARRVINPPEGPKPLGPYSQAVEAGGFLFISGQIPVDPSTGEVVSGGIREQTRRVLENVKVLLRAAGYSLRDVVKVTVYLKDLSLFDEFNEEYSRCFPSEPPARTTVEVSSLPRGALLELELVAFK